MQDNNDKHNGGFIKDLIYSVRGVKVMLDADLAAKYGYTTKAFNQQVKNNIEKFDDDFRFQLTKGEYYEILRSKFLTLKMILINSISDDSEVEKALRSKNLTLELGQGKFSKYLPFVFTEQGVYMLMTVLKGELATQQSKALVRAFKIILLIIGVLSATGNCSNCQCRPRKTRKISPKSKKKWLQKPIWFRLYKTLLILRLAVNT